MEINKNKVVSNLFEEQHLDKPGQPLKKYVGSCHCGSIRYESDLNLSKDTLKCNCSSCFKARVWETTTKPCNFKFKGDESMLGCYQFGIKETFHYFCKNCGVRVFSKGYLKEIGGEYVAIHLNTLDDLSQSEFSDLKVICMNGKDDKFDEIPEYTSHL